MDIFDAAQFRTYLVGGNGSGGGGVFFAKDSALDPSAEGGAFAQAVKSLHDPRKDLYVCSSSEEHDSRAGTSADAHVLHFCSTATSCPVHAHNVREATRQQTHGWKPVHNLCHLKHKLATPGEAEANVPVRLIVIGGSTTAGSGAFGCCCDEKLDPSCPILSNARKDDRDCGTGGGSAMGCTFWSYILRWLRGLAPPTSLQANTAPPQIQLYLMVEGGCNSVCMGHSFSSRAQSMGLTLPLRASDLVLVDLSVNDARDFSYGLRPDAVALNQSVLVAGLDNLVRKLLGGVGVGGVAPPPTVPNIVLLEHYSNPVHSKEVYERWRGAREGDYGVAYAQVAKHYGLLLWSARDAVFSHDAQASQSNHTLDYLQFHHQYKFSIGHPPWFTNMFHADLVAELIRDEWAVCNKSALATAIARPDRLPPSLSNHSTFHECAAGDEVLLRVSAEDAFKNVSAQIAGNWSTGVGWRLEQDRSNKFGFVNVPPPQQHQQNGGDDGALVFSFPSPLTKLSTLDRRLRMFYSLNVKFMRTYENAGAVNVTLCGRSVAVLDAMWPPELKKRVSTNEFFSLVWDDSWDEGDRWRGSGAGCGGGSDGLARLVFNPIAAATTADADANRGTRKVKLVHVELCHFTNGDKVMSGTRRAQMKKY